MRRLPAVMRQVVRVGVAAGVAVGVVLLVGVLLVVAVGLVVANPYDRARPEERNQLIEATASVAGGPARDERARDGRAGRQASAAASGQASAAASGQASAAARGQASGEESGVTGMVAGGEVDGDTLWRSDGARVRVIGIDTPEKGQCGYQAAANVTARFVGAGFSLARSATTDDRDVYGRLLRYVRDRDGRDLGAHLLRRGLAVARYDSLDGYDWHAEQRRYRRIDAHTPNMCGFDPVRGDPPDLGTMYSQGPSSHAGNAAIGVDGGDRDTNGPYARCSAARADGVAPLLRDDPGYGSHLDADDDGVACE